MMGGLKVSVRRTDGGVKTGNQVDAPVNQAGHSGGSDTRRGRGWWW